MSNNIRSSESLSREISGDTHLERQRITRLERQRIRRSLITDEELSIRREGDRVRRFDARLLRETSIEQESRIREKNSRCRYISRNSMTDNEQSLLRDIDSSRRAIARIFLSVEDTAQIRHNNTGSRNLARTNLSQNSTHSMI